jgi:hypothetical protein
MRGCTGTFLWREYNRGSWTKLALAYKEEAKMNIVLWVLQVLLAVAFLMAGAMKAF